MSAMKTLHFSFGPVQDFIAQARRTRDLWAGSYLLSYLSGHAMLAVEASRGKVVFPPVNGDSLLTALSSGSPSEMARQVGSLPNRFKASVPQSFDAVRCREAIEMAWKAVADVVWQKIGRPSDSIWMRQIGHVWEYYWVFDEDGSALDQRKNLRTRFLPVEKGEKCTVCGERQEISGKGMGTHQSRQEMRDWWDQLRTARRISKLDLRENERLCAVCLTKRLFPHVFDKVKVDGKVIGWCVPQGFPSTSYMAAVDWIIRVLEECKGTNGSKVNKAVFNFVEAARAAGVGCSEITTRIQGVSDGLKHSGLQDDAKLFVDLDGAAFFESSIRNADEFPLTGDRVRLIEALKILQCTLPDKKGLPSEATPFYGLLLMDGDDMSSLLHEVSNKDEGEEAISKALAKFTRKVPDIFKVNNGRLIYAGGDDVFALMPLDKALTCAATLRHAYQEAFGQEAPFIPQVKATLSGAIVYTHIHTALSTVVRDAHLLLRDVAKNQTGRDSIVCRVWKRGGPVLTWSLPWRFVLGGGGSTLVDEIKQQFQDDSADPGRFSSKFFYKIRDLFEVLEPSGGVPVAPAVARPLLAAEYLANRELAWPANCTVQQKRQIAEARVEKLLVLCREQRRKLDGIAEMFVSGCVRPDGALLVRFLSQKEV